MLVVVPSHPTTSSFSSDIDSSDKREIILLFISFDELLEYKQTQHKAPKRVSLVTESERLN